jgi:glycosyltransferase involved in cell wall biosynthesis
MKISILLPYKENFSSDYAGAVSIFIKDTTIKSIFKKKIFIYGNTNYKNKLLSNYVNLPFKKKFLQSGSKNYVKSFLNEEKKNKSNIIEIHNRPAYISSLLDLNYTKLVLYFHNDPLEMNGSKNVNDRIFLLDTVDKIIFNSEWSKNRFISDLPKNYQLSNNLLVIKQSIDKTKINLKSKKKIITFIGKLNTAKGYDLFGQAVCKILDKYKDWKAIVIGDEPREKIFFEHSNLEIMGFQKHKKVLNILKKTSIAVACSRWNEPFGRASLEAASRGCAVIISNKGGLPETITDGIILKNLSVKDLYNNIEKLILNEKLRLQLQIKSLKNFFLSNKFITKKIDNYRDIILSSNQIYKNKSLKILHITNLNERHNGRLFYNTGRRINNGFIRLNHSVMNLSDRDIISKNRRINDLDGSKKLNDIFIKTVHTYKPNLIILGHADSIKKQTLFEIKNKFPNIKIGQWFLDRMDSEWKNNKKRFTDKINLVDCSFCTTDPGVLNFNKKNKIYYMPNPVDISFEDMEVYKNKDPDYDLFFAMSHGVHRGTLKKGKFDERELFLRKLIKMNNMNKFDIYGIDNMQPLWADNFKKQIYKSKMALNLSQGKPLKYYSSDRISQLIGNGLLTFIDKKTQLNHFFNDDEVVFYSSLKDLSNKIKRFSNNDALRKKIAKKGRYKYHKNFNSTIIADFIINKTLGVKKKYSWERDN